MSNLYEILEVSEKASKEVIEKAYRVLAKKYHPDLQAENEKQKAEDKMKQINEAYEILSDNAKRAEYDLALQQEREEQKRINEIEKQMRNTQTYSSKVDYPKTDYQQVEQREEIRKQQEEYQNRQKLQNEMNRLYAQAYNQYLRRLRL